MPQFESDKIIQALVWLGVEGPAVSIDVLPRLVHTNGSTRTSSQEC